VVGASVGGMLTSVVGASVGACVAGASVAPGAGVTAASDAVALAGASDAAELGALDPGASLAVGVMLVHATTINAAPRPSSDARSLNLAAITVWPSSHRRSAAKGGW